jgi:hypothetical protein
MADLFATAQFFLPIQNNQNDPERIALINNLKTLLNSCPFLTIGEKGKMEMVIPAFTNAMIGDLQQTLIRQNLRYLQSKSQK